MKRRQPFDEEEMFVEKHSRRRSDELSNDIENMVKKENVVSQSVSNSTSDYAKLNEQYSNLEMKYGEAMSLISTFEQTKYEDEEFVKRITEERDEAKKKAEKAEIEKENAEKKCEATEAFNKDLNVKLTDAQTAVEKLEMDNLDLEDKMNLIQKERESEKQLLEAELSKMCDEKKLADDQIITLQMELVDFKNAAEEKSSAESANTLKLVSQINELQNAVKTKDINIAAFKKESANVRQDLMELKNQVAEANVKVGNLKDAVSNSRSIVEEKDRQVAELLKKSEAEQLEHKKGIDEAEAFVKNLQNQLLMLRADYSMAEEQISNLQNENTRLQNQLEKERLCANQERENYMVEYENIEALHGKMVAENSKIKAEKEMLEKKFETLQNNSNAKIAEIEASVTDRANEMFIEWKKKEKGMKKIKREASSSEINLTTKYDESVIKNGERQGNYEPQWIVPKAECLEIYKSNHDKIANFLNQYISHLFNPVEIMLPEEKLDKEKMADAEMVALYFWRPENDTQKELVLGALKRKLKEKRYSARAAAYKSCTSNRSVAFTSDGKQFYYSLQKYVWKPVADKECEKIKKFKRTHHSAFGVPSEYASSEYILIVQDCPEEGQKMFKMLPTGYIECIFKKGHHHEKKSTKKE